MQTHGNTTSVFSPSDAIPAERRDPSDGKFLTVRKGNFGENQQNASTATHLHAERLGRGDGVPEPPTEDGSRRLKLAGSTVLFVTGDFFTNVR